MGGEKALRESEHRGGGRVGLKLETTTKAAQTLNHSSRLPSPSDMLLTLLLPEGP